MERRQTPRKDWIVGQDEVGRAVLEWDVADPLARGPNSNARARSYDPLSRLDTSSLTLAEDSSSPNRAKGSNPYDTGRLFVGEKFRD
jgi:hypothetical protein